MWFTQCGLRPQSPQNFHYVNEEYKLRRKCHMLQYVARVPCMWKTMYSSIPRVCWVYRNGYNQFPHETKKTERRTQSTKNLPWEIHGLVSNTIRLHTHKKMHAWIQLCCCRYNNMETLRSMYEGNALPVMENAWSSKGRQKNQLSFLRTRKL